MKKVLLFLLVVSSVLFSCKNESKNSEKIDPSVVADKSPVPVAELSENEQRTLEPKKQRFSQTQFIRDEVGLYYEVEDGKMHYAKLSELGDSVWIYLNDDGSIEQKLAQHLIANQKAKMFFDFVHVKYEEDSFWVRADFISGKNSQKLFLVKENTFVYAEPEDYMISSKVVEKGTLVALADGGDKYDKFCKCVYYDAPFKTEVYLKRDALSDDEEMIEIELVFQNMKKRNSWLVRDEVILNLINALKPTDPIEYISYLTDKIKKFAEKEELAPEVWSALENLQQAQKNEKSKEDEFLGGAK